MASEIRPHRMREQIEQALAREGLPTVVEDDGTTIRLEGMVETPEAKVAATDVAMRYAAGRRLENNLEVEQERPETLLEAVDGQPTMGDLPESLDEMRAAGGEFEPDFTDQELETSVVEMGGEASATDDPMPDGETVFFPPTDPVMRTNDQGDIEVLGGFGPTSMSSIEVERSALDGRLGDEAIADAIRRELREDALTTDLVIRVSVTRGVVRLHGAVPTLDDAENAEEVAGRVPGVVEVVEELDIAAL